MYFTSNTVAIEEPPRCLFHYQHELRGHAESSKNNRLKSHMQLCLQYMEKILHREIKILNEIKLSQSKSYELEQCDLWMLFQPGCLVYQKLDGNEVLTRLQSISDEKNYQNEIKSWILEPEYISWNGIDIGRLTGFVIKIPRYEGCKLVCDLNAVFLTFLPEEPSIRHDLLERGRKFISLCGIHHCFYDGMAILWRVSSFPATAEFDRTNVSVLQSYLQSYLRQSYFFIETN